MSARPEQQPQLASSSACWVLAALQSTTKGARAMHGDMYLSAALWWCPLTNVDLSSAVYENLGKLR